ncbi:MAG: M48 family metalloprotease [gamma proteobacterium symbiont of Bathyaustriella thionipta]|nr:M48 family metalloprotease [gamma proteobacterium symbiont of Bathyaustriella thionipta]MCU7950108.1 M48 family metalloprotease [gamma proteobacterium symbiont of Bathyaustriella thionipta]MCU7953477.1 M48 family metalloprotease [gamma proteobacterium symbiont of Bathyaustriella thionipta]MCU7955574.1 M48 family metalloprotease [gamma proteobacterium symbiont of Bathyaustriella thionipta]
MKKQVILYFNLLLCISLLYRPLLAQEIKLPDIGASSSIALTPHMEEQIGRDIAKQIRNSHQVIDDLELNEYLQNLGYSLVANSDDAYQNFHFFLIGSNQINAFATPGGVVAVYSGLFLTTDTESELASVLGHEIAHVTQRHLARSFEKANQLSLPIMAGMIAGILLGAAGGDSSLGAATALGLSAAGQQAQINYTRANEKEADRVGMRYLSRSGYDPSGMHGFFQKLERKNRYVGNYPEFLRTHPITINRIAEATQRAEQYKRAMKRFKSPLTYRLMKAKLTVLTAANTEQVVHYYQEKVEKNDQTIHPEYYFGYGLALSKKRAYNQSIELFKELHNSSPENISYVIALANAYIASGKKSAIQTGLKLLADTFKNKSYNLVLTADYANALMQTGQIKKSIHLLENYNKDNFKHPSIYKLLSIALGKNKELVKAHIAESNYYYLKGMLSAAIEQLKIAKKITPKNDFYTLSKLDSQKQAHLEEKQLYTLDE